MGNPESLDRDALKLSVLENALTHVAFMGFKDDIITQALQDIGQDSSWSWRLFPEGTRDLIEFWSQTLDQQMLEHLNNQGTENLKVREKIALAVKTRIELLAPHRDAARQASLYLMKPQHSPLALRLTSKTVNEIWYWAGDKSTDYNYYTKRLLLGGVYTSTLAFWMRDESEGYTKTWDFLNKRIENVLALPKFPQKAKTCAKDIISRAGQIVSALRP